MAEKPPNAGKPADGAAASPAGRLGSLSTQGLALAAPTGRLGRLRQGLPPAAGAGASPPAAAPAAAAPGAAAAPAGAGAGAGRKIRFAPTIPQRRVKTEAGAGGAGGAGGDDALDPSLPDHIRELIQQSKADAVTGVQSRRPRPGAAGGPGDGPGSAAARLEALTRASGGAGPASTTVMQPMIQSKSRARTLDPDAPGPGAKGSAANPEAAAAAAAAAAARVRAGEERYEQARTAMAAIDVKADEDESAQNLPDFDADSYYPTTLPLRPPPSEEEANGWGAGAAAASRGAPAGRAGRRGRAGAASSYAAAVAPMEIGPSDGPVIHPGIALTEAELAGGVLLFQLPPALPLRPLQRPDSGPDGGPKAEGEPGEDGAGSGGEGGTPGDSLAGGLGPGGGTSWPPGGAFNSSESRDGGAASLTALGAGYLGQLLVYASGAVRLRLGPDLLLDVRPGGVAGAGPADGPLAEPGTAGEGGAASAQPACQHPLAAGAFRQEVLAVDPRRGVAAVVGPVAQRVVASPDVTALLAAAAAGRGAGGRSDMDED